MLRTLVIFSLVSLWSAVSRNKDACSPDGILMYKTSDKDKQSCRKCLCGNEIRSFCENIECFPSNRTVRVTLKDSCDYKWKLYKEADVFLDYCNECICMGNDSARCTNVSCDLHRLSSENVTDRNSDCTYKGHTYPLARTFFDGCTECYCSVFGRVACLEGSCPPYTWILKIEDSCEYNGFFYSKYQEFLDEDCQLCICLGNDRLICTTILCNKQDNFYAVNPDTLTGKKLPNYRPRNMCNFN